MLAIAVEPDEFAAAIGMLLDHRPIGRAFVTIINREAGGEMFAGAVVLGGFGGVEAPPEQIERIAREVVLRGHGIDIASQSRDATGQYGDGA